MLSVEELGDDFSKRLEGGGRRRSGVKMPPSGRSKSISRAGRRKTLDPSMLPGEIHVHPFGSPNPAANITRNKQLH